MSTMPTRIDGELFDAARVAGQVASRSAAQQINHWARIGRALETSPVSQRDITRVLNGDLVYDALTDTDQAVVRVLWDDAIGTAIADLDLEADLTAADETWTEADADGHPVTRHA